MRTGDLHPRDAKLELAHEIVSIYHGEEAAVEAEAAFRTVFQDQGIPEDMPEYALQPGQTLVDVMVESGLVPSKSQARRLIQQNGVKLDESSSRRRRSTRPIGRPGRAPSGETPVLAPRSTGLKHHPA